MKKSAAKGRPRVSAIRIAVPTRQQHRFYGHGLPHVDLQQLSGKLIVVEGADGSGRSSQIAGLGSRVILRATARSWAGSLRPYE